MRVYELYCQDELILTAKGMNYSEVQKIILSAQGNHLRKLAKSDFKILDYPLKKYKIKKFFKKVFSILKITYHVLSILSIATLITLAVLYFSNII